MEIVCSGLQNMRSEPTVRGRLSLEEGKAHPGRRGVAGDINPLNGIAILIEHASGKGDGRERKIVDHVTRDDHDVGDARTHKTDGNGCRVGPGWHDGSIGSVVIYRTAVRARRALQGEGQWGPGLGDRGSISMAHGASDRKAGCNREVSTC